MRALDTFHGGVHPPQHKDESSTRPIAVAPVPSRLVVPLQQHIGMIAKPLVKAGDRVLKGQMIGQAEGFISRPHLGTRDGRGHAIDPASFWLAGHVRFNSSRRQG
jgi:electron transport complex protein RnfC